MKKLSFILVPLCLGLFIGLRLLPAFVSKREASQEAVIEPRAKLTLPKPVLVNEELQEQPSPSLPVAKKSVAAREHFETLLNHPWIATQKEVEEISFEMVRDIEALSNWHKALKQSAAKSGRVPLSQEEMTAFFIDSLHALQEKLPFTLPKKYYNVLNIAETTPEQYPTPLPFQVHQRLYLGESELGLPFYLDVRVFPLQAAEEKKVQEVLDWHFALLKGGKEAFIEVGKGAFLGRGESKDSSMHGFEALQGDRGLFFKAVKKEEALYLIYANAPWDTFSKYLNVFEEL